MQKKFVRGERSKTEQGNAQGEEVVLARIPWGAQDWGGGGVNGIIELRPLLKKTVELLYSCIS